MRPHIHVWDRVVCRLQTARRRTAASSSRPSGLGARASDVTKHILFALWSHTSLRSVVQWEGGSATSTTILPHLRLRWSEHQEDAHLGVLGNGDAAEARWRHHVQEISRERSCRHLDLQLRVRVVDVRGSRSLIYRTLATNPTEAGHRQMYGPRTIDDQRTPRGFSENTDVC